MAWFKADDKFHTSGKVLSIPRRRRLAAVGLWLLAGTWSAQNLTDGRVPKYVLDELGATDPLIQALVNARLWDAHPSSDDRVMVERASLDVRAPLGHIQFRSWAEYQPTREHVEDQREQWAERQRKARARRDASHSESRVTHAGVTPAVTGVSPSPVPSRPVPTNTPPRSAQSDPDGFSDFWNAYPRKTGRGAARTAYTKALTKSITPEELAAAATDYATTTTTAHTEERFIPHPATWLNQERWTDRPNLQATGTDPISPWDRKYTREPDDA